MLQTLQTLSMSLQRPRGWGRGTCHAVQWRRGASLSYDVETWAFCTQETEQEGRLGPRTDFFLNPAIRVLGEGFHLNENSPGMKAMLVGTPSLRAALEFAHTRERD